MADELRIKIVETIYNGGSGHIPSSLSIIDIIDVLYDKFLKYDAVKPENEDRDMFFLSKGHGCVALYCVLEKHGFITQSDLDNYNKIGGILGGHPDSRTPGVEACSGSLGIACVVAVGTALGLRIKNKKNKVISLVGDSEVQEGSIAEMCLLAANLKLGNYCVIVDNNRSGEQIHPISNIKQRFEAFGWNALDVNGHNKNQILNALNSIDFESDKPTVIVAETKKGCGIKMMEENFGYWHSRPINADDFIKIKEELSNL